MTIFDVDIKICERLANELAGHRVWQGKGAASLDHVVADEFGLELRKVKGRIDAQAAPDKLENLIGEGQAGAVRLIVEDSAKIIQAGGENLIL